MKLVMYTAAPVAPLRNSLIGYFLGPWPWVVREAFSKIPENASAEERLQYFGGKGLVDGQIVFRGRKTQCLQLRDQLNIDLSYRNDEEERYNVTDQIMDEEIVKAGGTLAQDWVEQQTSDPIERWVLKKIDRLDGSYRRHMTPEEIQAAMRLTAAGVLKKQEMPQFQALERWVKSTAAGHTSSG